MHDLSAGENSRNEAVGHVKGERNRLLEKVNVYKTERMKLEKRLLEKK